MIKTIKCWLAKKIVRHVFLSIDEDDILKVRGNKMFRHGFELPQQDTHSIVTGAQSMQQLETWNIIKNDTRFMLYDKIFNTAQSADDLLFARGGLWVVEIMEKKIANLSRFR